MSDTVERNTQVGRALANANVSEKRVSGIYIIWPGWSNVPFMKLGLTTNIYSRAMNGYSHYMPFADPVRSFDLIGYMVVAPSLVRARETSVLKLASKQNGWETPLHDKEWRRWLGASGDVYMAIAKLLATLRTTVDGLWYSFERGTGKILMQGRSHISLDQALVLPLIPNVLTRSLWGRNVRQAGKVQVIIGSGGGATVAGADNNPMVLRRHEMKIRPRLGCESLDVDYDDDGKIIRMGSPISNAQADRLIANARARMGERRPRINVTGAPYFRAIPQVLTQVPRQVPRQVQHVALTVARAPTVALAPTVARPVTTMVNYQPSAMRIRSNRYNLSVTKMKNINVRIGSLNEIFLEVALALALAQVNAGSRVCFSEALLLQISKKEVYTCTTKAVSVKTVFTRKSRVTLNSPKDLEDAMNFRLTQINYGFKNRGNVDSSKTMLSHFDSSFSFNEVTDVSGGGYGGGGSGDFLIADAPTVNCIINPFIERLQEITKNAQGILDITPAASRGRPKKGEIKDKELIAEHNETRKKHSRELKNAETII
ncbi:hypothetical protein T492DRAFT_842921 [Pavlovales sp. CCMP2436]|nr:hypothetical protein T492DRAFT_842921 [Pavlovales sp. CCMP2436]